VVSLIEKYRDFLPVSKNTPIVSLQEGNTPLLEAPRLAQAINFPGELYLKYDGANPTGSFKDRGMTVAVSKAVEDKVQAVICASTGNTSASAAAYASRAGLKCIVLIPEGAIASGKLAQVIIAGAKIVPIKDNFDKALTLVREIVEKYHLRLVNSLNPHRIEGQKTASFEICDELKNAPDFLALPVGNAGNITAYWKGFREYHAVGKISRLPRMLGFQAEGAAPIVHGRVFEHPETIATAIRIGNPASWQKAVAARDESQGLIDSVSDEQILEAYQLLAHCEGVFSEPASAASVAGVKKLAEKGFFKDNHQVVCVLTGHGLKDPERAASLLPPQKVVQPTLEAVVETIELTENYQFQEKPQ